MTNSQDLTRRNLVAAKKRTTALDARLERVEQDVSVVVAKVIQIEANMAEVTAHCHRLEERMSS